MDGCRNGEEEDAGDGGCAVDGGSTECGGEDRGQDCPDNGRREDGGGEQERGAGTLPDPRGDVFVGRGTTAGRPCFCAAGRRAVGRSRVRGSTPAPGLGSGPCWRGCAGRWFPGTRSRRRGSRWRPAPRAGSGLPGAVVAVRSAASEGCRPVFDVQTSDASTVLRHLRTVDVSRIPSQPPGQPLAACLSSCCYEGCRLGETA